MSSDHFYIIMGNGMTALRFNGPISAADHTFEDQPSGIAGYFKYLIGTRKECVGVLPTQIELMCTSARPMCGLCTFGINSVLRIYPNR